MLDWWWYLAGDSIGYLMLLMLVPWRLLLLSKHLVVIRKSGQIGGRKSLTPKWVSSAG